MYTYILVYMYRYICKHISKHISTCVCVYIFIFILVIARWCLHSWKGKAVGTATHKVHTKCNRQIRSSSLARLGPKEARRPASGSQTEALTLVWFEQRVLLEHKVQAERVPMSIDGQEQGDRPTDDWRIF